jgi:hypothetical protein
MEGLSSRMRVRSLCRRKDSELRPRPQRPAAGGPCPLGTCWSLNDILGCRGTSPNTGSWGTTYALQMHAQ